MKLLEDRIRKDGILAEGNVLKVDCFLNHLMDVELFHQMGMEFKRLFADKPINKILTIEASGIGIACVAAECFHVPVLFAKKSQSINLSGEVYATKVQSFTHKRVYDVVVSKKFIGPEDHVLIIDDFLANGCALQGLIELVQDAGATVEGIGISWKVWTPPPARSSSGRSNSHIERILPGTANAVPGFLLCKAGNFPGFDREIQRIYMNCMEYARECR